MLNVMKDFINSWWQKMSWGSPVIMLLAVVLIIILWKKHKDIKEIFFRSKNIEFGAKFRRGLNKLDQQIKKIGTDDVQPMDPKPAQEKFGDKGKQTTRDIVLEAWGGLKQMVFSACSANKIDMTPATVVPVAAERLCEAKIIDDDIVSLISTLHELAKNLSNHRGEKLSEDDALAYKDFTDLVVDWMMLNVFAPRKVNEPKTKKEPQRRETIVGEFPQRPQQEYRPVYLIGIGGHLQGERFPIDKAYIRIGRSSKNEICVTGDDYVSGQHALLRFDRGSLLLSDMGSRNGTFLNDAQVKGTDREVKPGDRIRLGESLFEISDSALPGDKAAKVNGHSKNRKKRRLTPVR